MHRAIAGRIPPAGCRDAQYIETKRPRHGSTIRSRRVPVHAWLSRCPRCVPAVPHQGPRSIVTAEAGDRASGNVQDPERDESFGRIRELETHSRRLVGFHRDPRTPVPKWSGVDLAWGVRASRRRARRACVAQTVLERRTHRRDVFRERSPCGVGRLHDVVVPTRRQVQSTGNSGDGLTLPRACVLSMPLTTKPIPILDGRAASPSVLPLNAAPSPSHANPRGRFGSPPGARRRSGPSAP